jgi:hypothetical protein
MTTKMWPSGVAKQARLKLDAETGKKVVSPQNAKQLRLLGQSAVKVNNPTRQARKG